MKRFLLVCMVLLSVVGLSCQAQNHRFRLIGAHTTDLFQYKLDQSVYMAPGSSLNNIHPYEVTAIWWWNGTEVRFPGNSGITNNTTKDIVILVGYRGYLRPEWNMILFQRADFPPITDFSH